jgi:hypothetical protein
MDGRTDGRTDGRMDGWTDGRMDGRMDGWTDGRMELLSEQSLLHDRMPQTIASPTMSTK